MAGTNPDFPTSEFREQIRSIMTASAPQKVAERVTFYWNTQRTFAKADAAGVPFDLNAAPTVTTTTPSLQVPVAVQFAGQTDDETAAFGRMDMSNATLTICDVDYEEIKDADYVSIGGDIYDIDSVQPQGLYDFTVYTMHVHARTRS